MDLLVNKTLDYVEFENLDQHWTGYVLNWNKKVDLEIIVDAGKIFRIRPRTEKYRDRYVVVFDSLVDIGEYYPDQDSHWKSLSEPRVQDVRFLIKENRWSWILTLPLAIFLYLSK